MLLSDLYPRLLISPQTLTTVAVKCQSWVRNMCLCVCSLFRELIMKWFRADRTQRVESGDEGCCGRLSKVLPLLCLVKIKMGLWSLCFLIGLFPLGAIMWINVLSSVHNGIVTLFWLHAHIYLSLLHKYDPILTPFFFFLCSLICHFCH